MPEYQVDLEVTGTASVRVIADSEAEAFTQAEESDFSDLDGFNVIGQEPYAARELEAEA